MSSGEGVEFLEKLARLRGEEPTGDADAA
jgi:hypothetical protein